jgi:hypothetical protein
MTKTIQRYLHIIVDTTDMVAVVMNLYKGHIVVKVAAQRRLVARVEEEVVVPSPAVVLSRYTEEVHIPHKASQHKMAVWHNTLCQEVDREVEAEVAAIRKNDAAAIGFALPVGISIVAENEGERDYLPHAWQVLRDLVRD